MRDYLCMRLFRLVVIPLVLAGILGACSASTPLDDVVVLPSVEPVVRPTPEPGVAPDDASANGGAAEADQVPPGEETCGTSVTADGGPAVASIPEHDAALNVDALSASPPDADADPAAPAVLLSSSDPDQKFVLGPAWPIAFVEVTPELIGPGYCSFTLTLDDASFAYFNELAAACFERAAICPLGRVATVVADEVVSDPTINAPTFSEPLVTLTSGEFGWTPSESPAFAGLIASNAQIRPVLAGPLPAS